MEEKWEDRESNSTCSRDYSQMIKSEQNIIDRLRKKKHYEDSSNLFQVNLLL